MSIEKLNDDSKIYVERNPYTQILNNLIENIKDNDAYRIYSYLASKSRDWVVAKEWTAKKCSVGERKAKQVWSYLERCGLIEYIHTKNEQGKFIKHDVKVLNGSRFDPNVSFLNTKTTGADSAPLVENHRCNYPPSGKTTRVDSAPLLNKDLINKDLKQNKDKSSCAYAQKEANKIKHGFAENMDKRALEKKRFEKQENNYRRNEVRSTVQFYEPGNPDYDRVHGAPKHIKDLIRA